MKAKQDSAPMTEAEWVRVEFIKVWGYFGTHPTPEDRQLLERARKQDPERSASIDRNIWREHEASLVLR